jgi:hypothetical protein
MADEDDMASRPAWDDARAQAMVGSHVLVGLTRIGPTGDRYEQMFGTVRSASAATGFEIELAGSRKGETYWLPPHIDAFESAPPGEYRLKSTGEVVLDPDYLATWTIETRH